MISDKYKCIFIHIPKTAGTSIEQKLGHFKELQRGVQDHRSISEIEPISFHHFFKFIRKPDLYQVKKILKKAYFDYKFSNRTKYRTYFKFAFVRNPWARVFSWYQNVMRDVHHKKRFNIADDYSFKDFVSCQLHHFELRPQLFWLMNHKNEIPMDFIGRYENLTSDFLKISEFLAIENPNLPKLITGSGKNYKNYYDQEMIEIVKDFYQDEISLFNFKFGD